MSKLWVVMPVYNEEIAIEGVATEWQTALKSAADDFTFCILNDGSKDSTLPRLRKLSARYPEIRVVDKKNSGHGQTCVEGYRLALQEGAEWIFQIDSDGQCDPAYFPTFWEQKDHHPLLLGYRRRRDDGWARYLVSRILSFAVFLSMRRWVKDLNVPYRLMRADQLLGLVPRIPKDFDLANVLIAVLLAERSPITWIDIRFRKRHGGSAKSKLSFFAKKAFQLGAQLRAYRKTAASAPSIVNAKEAPVENPSERRPVHEPPGVR